MTTVTTSQPQTDISVLHAQLQQLQQENARLSLINQFAIDLHELTGADDILNYAAKHVVAGLGFVDCAIFILAADGETLVRKAATGTRDLPSHLGISELKVGDGLVGYAASIKQSVLVSDTRDDPHYLADLVPSLSELVVPILDGDELLGVLDCEHSQINYFSVEHQQILEVVASILASKLRKSQMLDTLESSVSKLEYAERLQKALYEIASFSYFANDFSSFYKRLHQIVNSLIYAPNFFIALFDDETQTLQFPYFADTEDEIDPNQVYGSDVLEHSLTGHVFRSKQPLLICRQQMADFDREHQVRTYGSEPESWLGVPFQSSDTVRGVVVVQSYVANIQYSERDLELMIFVSQHISNALERVFSEKRLQHQALHDALTALPNRSLLMDRIGQAFKRMQRFPANHLAVMYLDLDRFKTVNDTLGHQVGDAFLIQVGRVLKLCMRQTDTLARLGGDEFAVVLEDVASLADVTDVAQRIIQALQQPLLVGDHMLLTSCSIGIALASSEDQLQSADELIRRADIAMYQAKQDGRGVYRIYSSDMKVEESQEFRLGLEIKAALAKQHFMLHYQPIISLDTDDTIGFEALIRWTHQSRGAITPDEFIPYAEKNGLIGLIDHYVLRQSIEQIRLWRQNYAMPFYVSVNVSGLAFSEPDFAAAVIQKLAEADVPARYLAIEITERALIENIEQARLCLKQLRQHGVKVLLDDFGTGYSSLSYLNEFKLDVLKIDRSFIANMKPRIQDNPVVNTVIALAKTLNLKVVAEGVETSLQRQLLKELGCDAGQGYWFAKALPAADAVKWLR
ncbi:EAL domain-containing protein [Rheinheimera faecalis]|uniref:EAL domain-containing protein n=1 Tax=Rheinheimera faecalis TaxID=2901141 RepID=UPI001E61B7A8|nr:EAL domain-containing protein [Rheinheimera faecalis]